MVGISTSLGNASSDNRRSDKRCSALVIHLKKQYNYSWVNNIQFGKKIVETFRNFGFFSFSFEVLIFYPVEKSNCSFKPSPTWPHFIYFCRLSLSVLDICWFFFHLQFFSFFSVFMFTKSSSYNFVSFSLLSVCLSVSFFSLSLSISLFLSLCLFFRLEKQMGWDQFNTTAWWFGFDCFASKVNE